MADLFADWYVHRVDVRTVGAVDEWGERTTSQHLAVPCMIEDVMTLVRGADGKETVSSARLWIALEDADYFLPGSEVAVRGRAVTVLSVGQSAVGDETDGAVVTLS